MLGSIIKDEDLLRALVISYFEPSTAENAAVRQALSYFLPVYCHSRRENMERMGKVGVAVVHALMGVMDELDDEEEMVGISVVGAHVVDWTDARKLVVPDAAGSGGWDEMGRKEVKALNTDVHLDLAVDILEKISSSGCSSTSTSPCFPFSLPCHQRCKRSLLDADAMIPAEAEKKALTSMLGKLYISPTSSADKLHAVHELVSDAIDAKIATDAPSRNALNKLLTALAKAIGTGGAAVPAKNDAEEGTMVAGEDESEEHDGGVVGVEKMDVVEEGDEEAEAKDSVLEELLDAGDEDQD